MWAPQLEGCSFLDLFAGSGVMAFEALSRGARSALLVEADARSAARLETLALELVGDRARVLRGRLPKLLARAPQANADLAFADPPYRFSGYEGLLLALAPWLTPGAEVAVEHSVRGETPSVVGQLERFDLRTWGDSSVSRYRLGTATTSVE